MNVEDYFAIFSIESYEDQKKRFLETLLEKARQLAITIELDKLTRKMILKMKRRRPSLQWQFL